MEGLHLVIAITDRERDDEVTRIFEDNNVFSTGVALGEGTAPPDILDYLYLSPSEKSITFGIITNTGLLPLIKSFKRRMRIDFPGNGIVVTIPLNSVGGRRSLEYLLEGQSIDLSSEKDGQTEREESMAVNTDYEMIFVIANEGYTDLIMDAARAAGARGGTVIKARRSGGDHTEKFFGFSIAKEKELHFLVTPAQGRNHIMKSIMEKAGLESKAQSIVFSLPVSHAIGLQLPEE